MIQNRFTKNLQKLKPVKYYLIPKGRYIILDCPAKAKDAAKRNPNFLLIKASRP